MSPDRPGRLRGHSWAEALKRTVREFRESDLTDSAAALTYYGILSLFPALIALVSILGLFGDPHGTADALTKIASDIGPQSTSDTFQEPIRNITSHRGTAGVLFFAGLAGALYSASGYIGAFTRAANAIYDVDEGRPFWKLRPLQIAVALVMVLLLAILVVALVVSGPLAGSVGEAVGLSAPAITVYGIAKWPLLGLVVMAMLAMLYYISPNVRMPGVRWVTPGSALALVVWALASAAFAFYVANFGSYDKTYGTLGGVITFLVWLWITNVAVLLGAVLNSELERSREVEAGLPGAEDSLQLPPREEPH